MFTTRDLFFWAPKVLDVIEQPLGWVLLLLIASLVLRQRRRDRAARRMQIAATMLLGAIGIVAVPEFLLQQLENTFPPTQRAITEFSGVIVLGGGMDGGSRALERGQPALTGSAERVTTAVAMARHSPQLKIIVTGYAGVWEPTHLSEAGATMAFFEQQNAPTASVVVEPSARNTFEIAENAKALPGVDATRPWLLLTSAWNMPRALLTFKKAGWNVEPMPVDYATGTTIRYLRYSILAGGGAWSRVLHELIGIAWYRLTGRL
jgi:uncharacterized SAM-binding protein YcdF (DUF218 family)